jgi:signal transduction histidine kinase/CheY-like chemotaxis protein
MTVSADLDCRLTALRRLGQARQTARRQRILNVATIAVGVGAMFDLWWIAGVWLAAFALVQSIMTRGFGALNAAPIAPATLRQVEHWAIFTAALAAIVYGAIAPFVWLADPVAGPIVALLMLCGAVIHVAITAHSLPAVFWANVIPMLAYMIAPLLYQLATGFGLAGWTAAQVVFGIFVFILQARAAFDAMTANAQSLRAAHQEALAHAQAARAANQAKSDFVSTVSHELRTPLNGMRGALALLSRKALQPDQAELVAAMQVGADTQVRLLNDLLDLAKIEAGKLDIEKAPYDPLALARELLTLFGPSAHDKGLSLDLDIAPDVPMQVIGDSFRVRQIMSNLISNAIKFTSQGGVQVTIRAGRRANGEGALCWSVRDTGIGLAPEARDRLFVAFVQGGADVARTQGGTGLGLAISKRLALLLQGDLQVQSVPGAGSEFTLETPLLAPDQVVARPAPPALLASPLAGTALIADDHAVCRMVLTRILESAGWRVTAVADGASAVAQAAAQRFDLILLDSRMPVMDGANAAQAMRLGGPNRATPIALVSADGMAQAPAGLFQGQLLKPYEPAALMALVAEMRAEAPASHAA